MRNLLTGLSALALATTAAPAMAQDETDPAPPVTVSGSATVVSDYKFRGISQTDGNFAVQAGITVSHESGFYVGVWGSSIDDYVTAHGTSHQEIDLIAGFKKGFDNGLTLDVGAIYYVYPGTRPGFPGDRTASDFIEPYASLAFAIGPVTAKASAAYAPEQKALALDQGQTGLPKNDNLYIAGDLSGSIPNTPIALTAHIGHTFGPSWLSIGKEYTDWSLGATYTWKSLTFGVSYVDTDGDFITPSGKNASKGAVLGSVGVAF